jgi:hypothetical protein
VSHRIVIMVHMQPQLALLDESGNDNGDGEDSLADWRLDERTREVGRLGLAAARRALQEAKRPTAA